MSKALDEQFNKHAVKALHLSGTPLRYADFLAGHEAGRAEEREAVLEIIVAVREADIQTNHWEHPITKHLCDELERRITERGQR